MLCAALATANVERIEALRICVLEHKLPEAFNTDDSNTTPYDLRVSALSIASQRMLEKVGAWDGIVARRACVYKRLSVWDGEKNGRTDFDANDIQESHLGHIVENRVIQLSLLDRIATLENVKIMSPAKMARYQQTKDGVEVTLEDDTKINAKLIVGADGANSMVRRLAGITIDKKEYPQHALVANIETELPQQDITWQRFVATGPQAFLPLCGHQGSIVWYHTKDEIDALKALSNDAFMERLQHTFPDSLGTVKAINARGAFPIAKAHAQDYIAARVALVGDAAHTVHPLAGQGVNIGLLDAEALAEVVVKAAVKERDIGSHAVLRRYQRMRYGDNQIMIAALDSIYEAFKPRSELVQQVRSASLNIVNKVSPLKHSLMRVAMGLK